MMYVQIRLLTVIIMCTHNSLIFIFKYLYLHHNIDIGVTATCTAFKIRCLPSPLNTYQTPLYHWERNVNAGPGGGS